MEVYPLVLPSVLANLVAAHVTLVVLVITLWHVQVGAVFGPYVDAEGALA